MALNGSKRITTASLALGVSDSELHWASLATCRDHRFVHDISPAHQKMLICYPGQTMLRVLLKPLDKVDV